ncbi:MAG: aminopeptidase P family protein [Alphaproteobacteria bacterium]|nr:aminopeptidase P family protein [Alphaproteobacteria bacterium]MBL6939060.1 aminopeptidase P family protein [Alphaproteobacteria bacterium]MBL7099652.1 aminopeptidase P family protein [Alphaproteobacteria bacterium]
MNERRAKLEEAEARGLALFDAIERAGLIRPGRREDELNDEINAFARNKFGVKAHWHKRIVRSGPNTVCTFYDDPPVHTIGPEDTVYLDLGPVLEDWEADLGRTYAMGGDPAKNRLVADLPRLFDLVAAHYRATPDITAEGLYAYACRTAEDAGWLFGGVIAGHTIHGRFPHAPLGREGRMIERGNKSRMRDPDKEGNERHWILEIHLVDKAKTFGGFYERLL